MKSSEMEMVLMGKRDFCDLVRIVLVALSCPLVLPLVVDSKAQDMTDEKQEEVE